MKKRTKADLMTKPALVHSGPYCALESIFLSCYERFRGKFSNFAAKQALTMEQKFGAVRAESSL